MVMGMTMLTGYCEWVVIGNVALDALQLEMLVLVMVVEMSRL